MASCALFGCGKDATQSQTGAHMLTRITQAMQQRYGRKCSALLGVIPGASYEHLSDYEQDDWLGQHLDLVFTIKHQKQRALNHIMRDRLRDGRDMKALGGRTPRPYRDGLLVRHALDNGVVQQMDLKEPFGLDLMGKRFAVAAGDEIRVYDCESSLAHVYRNPWFAQLHSVHFSANGKRLLAVSTGFDTVLEFDLTDRKLTWAWNAWDHGYNTSPAGIRLTHGASGTDATSHNEIVIADPSRWNGFGLPTYLTASHLNNACYGDDDGTILITLFHQGRAVIVERDSGKPQEVMTDLLNPHGFEPGWQGDYLVTDTRRGRVIFFDGELAVRCVLTIDGCEPTESRAGMGEWLQNVLHLQGGLYAAIDIHRSCIWLFEPATKRRRKVEVSQDWAVQNVIAVERQRLTALRRRPDEFPLVHHEILDPDNLMTMPGGDRGTPVLSDAEEYVTDREMRRAHLGG
jgi:hypothetical protein